MNERRLAVVTGGGQGIGWAIASRLETEGWHVVVAGLHPGNTPGTGVEFVQMDVRDRPGVEAAITGIAGERGRLDLLVNNAGIQRHARTEEMTWQDWSDVIDTNLNGAFNCLQVAGRLMLQGGPGQHRQHRVHCRCTRRRGSCALLRGEGRNRRPDARSRCRVGGAPPWSASSPHPQRHTSPVRCSTSMEAFLRTSEWASTE